MKRKKNNGMSFSERVKNGQKNSKLQGVETGLYKHGTSVIDGREVVTITPTVKCQELVMSMGGNQWTSGNPYYDDLDKLWNKIYSSFKYEWITYGGIVCPTDTPFNPKTGRRQIAFCSIPTMINTGISEEDYLSDMYNSIGRVFRYYKYRTLNGEYREYIERLVREKSVRLPISLWREDIIDEIENTLKKYSPSDLEKFLD